MFPIFSRLRANKRFLLLLVIVAACAYPPSALAGPFQIAWNGDGTIIQHGFASKVDAGASCSFPGNAASAQAGLFPGNGGCFFLFNAPGAATITSLSVAGHYNKASANANLCARSFAAVGSPSPLVACSGGDFAQTIPVAGGAWIELGLYNQSSSAFTLSTANANNALFTSGSVTLSDPTPPSLSVSGSVPAFIAGDTLALQFAATDPESRAGLVTWSLDGGGATALVGDGCSDVFVCGSSSSGEFAVSGLSALPDGRHEITVSAHSAGGDSLQSVPIMLDHTAPQETSALSVDYASRSVSLTVEDVTSGIGTATLFADGTPLPTQSSAIAGKPGSLLLSATIPPSARLDGALVDVAASDLASPANVLDTRAAGPHLAVPVRVVEPATSPASVVVVQAAGAQPSAAASGSVLTTLARARRARTSLSLSLHAGLERRSKKTGRELRLAPGSGVLVGGRLHGAAGRQHLRLQLGSGTHTQSWKLVTRSDGSFGLLMHPRRGGTLLGIFPGTARAAPARASAAATILLIPRISAQFSASAVPGGYHDVRVSGRFAPGGGAPLTLVWQARAPNGRWQLVGGLETRIHPDLRGRFAGSLALTLGGQVELRLVYLSTPGAGLASSASAGARPRLLA
jgi:hypothetical protein